MFRFLYSCVFYLAIPLVLLRLTWRSIREPGYREAISERFGFFRSAHTGEVIWIHAVSAGETIAAAPLVKRLVASGYPCLVTNMTPTGRERTRVLLGDTVENCYAPYDLPGSVSRFMRNNRPRLLVTIDTELWPNMLAGCDRDGVPAAVINGRMAARSAEGYARVMSLTRPLLASLDLIAVQTEPHAERFRALGARPETIRVTGSIKFDGEYSAGHESRLHAARELTGGRPLLLGASTHETEEEALLSALPSVMAVVPDVLLVLAPRHTHRADHVARQCESIGYPVRRYSEGVAACPDDRVLMLDTMGELESYFPLARVAFIGGSLVPVGGHNLLEAVRAGTAVIMGPHLYNVEDITQQFVDQEAILVVNDQQGLKDEVVGLMRDQGRTRRQTIRAIQVLEANRGSIERSEKLLSDLLSS